MDQNGERKTPLSFALLLNQIELLRFCQKFFGFLRFVKRKDIFVSYVKTKMSQVLSVDHLPKALVIGEGAAIGQDEVKRV